MNMNCKPGDMAVVVDSCCGNEGKIVVCLRLDTSGPVFCNHPDGSLRRSSPWWVVDKNLPDWKGQMSNLIEDSQLRPLRDPGDDATDETLAWLPVPSITRVTA